MLEREEYQIISLNRNDTLSYKGDSSMVGERVKLFPAVCAELAAAGRPPPEESLYVIDLAYPVQRLKMWNEMCPNIKAFYGKYQRQYDAYDKLNFLLVAKRNPDPAILRSLGNCATYNEYLFLYAILSSLFQF